MTPKSKKLIIIIIPIILILIIGLFLVLYFTTDFLKSSKTLFYKYMAQNVDTAKMMIDNKSEKEYSNKLKQNKYEATTEVKGSYVENSNSSEENKNNDINKLNINIDTQSEYLNNFLYKDIKIVYNNANALRTEYIHDGEVYGLRFPEKFNQFLAVENNDLKQIAKNAGLDEKIIELIPEKIQEYDINNVFSFSDEEIETLKNRYLDIIKNNIENDKYSKQKNALITINEKDVTTTAYSVTISKEKANDIYIKLLESLKTDEIILKKLSQMESISIIYNLIKNNENAYNVKYLEDEYVAIIEDEIEEIRQNNMSTSEVKYTVYQYKGNTIRTTISEEAKDVTIDTDVTDSNNLNIKIQNQTKSEDQENIQNIQISKTNNEEGNKFSIKNEKTLGEDISKIEIYRNKNITDSNATISTGINFDDGDDNLLNLSINDNITFNNEIDKKIKELDEVNCVIVNGYEATLVTDWTKQVIDYLKSVKEKNQTVISNIGKIKPIGNIFNIKQETTVKPETAETTEVEKNRFNSKFEFYTGKEKKAEDVIKLLEEAKTSVKSAQVSYNNEGSTEGTKKLSKIELEVENEANKDELVDSIKDMLDTSNTYTVETIKNENDLVVKLIIAINK